MPLLFCRIISAVRGEGASGNALETCASELAPASTARKISAIPDDLAMDASILLRAGTLYPLWVDTIPPVGIVKREIVKMSTMDREKIKLLQRLRKVRGQLDAVERSLNADEDCGGQLMLLAAVRGGVNGLMGEVLETHIRFHLADGAKEQIAPELAEDLIDLVHAYLK